MAGQTCTFFGHRECFGLDRATLFQAIADLIACGVDTFYVGNQGQFDAMVHGCLKQLKEMYPHIEYSVVLAYLPTQKSEFDDFTDTLYPEGLEEVPPRFAIDRRNRWMIDRSDYCLCYVNQTWGGAYKFARQAKRHGLTVTNLGNVEIE